SLSLNLSFSKSPKCPPERRYHVTAAFCCATLIVSVRPRRPGSAGSDGFLAQAPKKGRQSFRWATTPALTAFRFACDTPEPIFRRARKHANQKTTECKQRVPRP